MSKIGCIICVYLFRCLFSLKVIHGDGKEVYSQLSQMEDQISFVVYCLKNLRKKSADLF